ncbi:MAG: UDP-N-acetylmuramoylalanyl-D-glutamyl-2,6-diaminopimelate--D-alanyl-D-alanine ligase [Nitratireductor sp.]|nr:UDP-N-acetylmuramoylalanyl-D-glutamyl-2,6-diaminopimelate--D-alanyl-D-alanine ligase [Nitratireductor sp.]
MSGLWTGDELVEAMQARPVGNVPETVTGISIDTRTLQQGEAFFAIKGEQFDGHDYVGAAQKAGASIAVIAEEKLVALGRLHIPLLVVSDVLEAMRKLARAARARTSAKIIAVTGSVGKTSTKEMLRLALASCGSVHASAASFNNHWGVPLTLARMPRDCDFGVFEIGMNHAGEITPLVAMVRPHVAMITNVAAAHLGSFDSIDGIAHAKAEIFTGLVEDGTGLINRDDKRQALLGELAEKAGVRDIRHFGTGTGCQYRATRIRELPDSSVVEARIGDVPVTYTIGAPGGHLVLNSLAVLAACQLAGADVAKCAGRMAQVVPEKGRGRRHVLGLKKGTATLIDESYNANPASMEAALKVLAAADTGSSGRRIAVLGDMLELGSSSRKLHAALKKPIQKAGVDKLWVVGSEMQALAKAADPSLLAGHFNSVAELAGPLAASIGDGDVIMVKASNGLRFSGLVETLLQQFQEPVPAKPAGAGQG